ncbi:hypothetical protein [Microbacterium sp. R86528]|uniref:hypothetical protein n=1 Tax=Microbacterium sp. R86528 TaxID=3093864 RepID=UPI0037CB0870
MIRRTTTAAALVAVAALFTACASAADAQPAPTVTVTVTPTPEAPVADDVDFGEIEESEQPISAYDAWALCVAVSETDVPSDYFIAMDYADDSVMSQDDGSWLVYVGFLSKDETVGLRTTCVISGTSLDPDVEYLGGQDFS